MAAIVETRLPTRSTRSSCYNNQGQQPPYRMLHTKVKEGPVVIPRKVMRVFHRNDTCRAILQCNRSGEYSFKLTRETGTPRKTTLTLSSMKSIRVKSSDHFLTVGSRVFVAGKGFGTLMYLGRHGFYSRDVLGVMLDSPVGNSTGEEMGHRYFKCAKNHGLLTSPDHIAPVSINGDVLEPQPTKQKKYWAVAVFESEESEDVTLEFGCESYFEMQGWVFNLASAAFQKAPEIPGEQWNTLYSNQTMAPWFNPLIDREETENLFQLAGMSTGIFLVRLSTSEPGKLVVSVCSKSGIQHLLIVAGSEVIRDQVEGGTFCINGHATPVTSMDDLIGYLCETRPDLDWAIPLRGYVDYRLTMDQPVVVFFGQGSETSSSESKVEDRVVKPKTASVVVTPNNSGTCVVKDGDTFSTGSKDSRNSAEKENLLQVSHDNHQNTYTSRAISSII